MKVKKWVLAFAAFVVMAVVCAVAAGAENYHAYIGFQTQAYSFRNSFDEETYGKNVANGKYFNSVIVWGGNDPTTFPEYSDCYDEDVDGYVLPATYTDVTISKDGTYKVGITDFDWALDTASSFNILLVSTDVPFDKYAGKSVAEFSNAKIIVDGKVTAEIADPMIDTEYGMKSGYTEVLFAYIWNKDLDSYTGAYPTKSLEIQFDVSIPWVTDFEYSLLDDGTIEITKYIGSESDVVIPDEIYGKKVTSIGEFAFSNNAGLTGIKIPDSVTSIGYMAFSGCTGLTSITMPSSVTYIGYWAFEGCTSLAAINVDVDNSNYASVNGVLYSKDKTTVICYPAGKGDNNYNIIDGVTSVDWYAFYGCENLTSITIPDSVTSIGRNAFHDCINIKNITIPDNVTEIGGWAFSGCTSLTSIMIPGNVTSIDLGAFSDCIRLTEIKVATQNSNYASVNGVLYDKDKTTVICYPTGKKDNNYKIINGVSSIGMYAFCDCESLTNLVIPNGTISIEQFAFDGCTSLKSITMPNSVTEIGSYAFMDCTSLTSITIPKNVTSIGDNALGYNWSDYYNDYIKSDNFKIHCYSGTAGEKYAKDNGFDYEILDGETQCTHSNTEIRNTKSANCITDGYTGDTYCKDCGELISSGEVIPATGNHKFGDWTITKAATCTTAGTKTKTCSVCGKTETATIAKTAHKYDNTVVKPTYTAKGYTLHKCSACGASYKDTYTATLTLAKVGGFKVKAKDSTSITLQWNRNANASGYIIEAYNGKTWVQVTKIAKNSTLTYKVTKLSASKTYQYRIKAYKTEGKATAYSANSATLSVNTNPTNMSGFKAKSKSYNSITLQWNKNASATGYELQKWDGKKWVTLTKINKNSTTTYTVKNLKASTTYKYRIRAYKTIGKTTQYSAYTTTLSVNTNPSNMSGYKVKSKTATSVTLQWNKNASATGYELQKWDGKKWVTLTKISKNSTTTYTVKSLKASTTYKYRIRAYKTIGKATQYSAYTATLSVNTNPTNMSGFKAKSKSYNSIMLQWNKNTSATGYELQKWDGKKWVSLTKIAKNSTTTYTVKSLKASTTYKYRIRAYKTIGKTTQYSAYTTTLSVNTNPTNMSGFKAKSKSYNSITLRWNKNTSATGYELQKWDGKKWVTLTKISKNSTTTYTVKSLKASTTYKYRIRAYKTIGKATQYSGYSATLSVNTNPSNISGFKAKSKSYNSITLQWNKNTSATGYELQKWNGKKWVTLTKISKNSTTTYTVKNLKAVTTYKFRIRAYKTIGKATQYSAYSATLSANTIPTNVSRFRLNSKTGKMLNLGWDMSDDAAGYIVQQYKGGKWVQVAKLGKSKYSVRIKDLSPSTTYKFRIRKYAKIGKTTVYGNWSYKSFKTEGKDCVDEVKFKPNGEKIDAFVAAHMDEVWNESYFDKPKKVFVKTENLRANDYPVPLYSDIMALYLFADSLYIIGETNNNYYITSDYYYVYRDYVFEGKKPLPLEYMTKEDPTY